MSDFLDTLKDWTASARELSQDVSNTAMQLSKDQALAQATRTVTQMQARYSAQQAAATNGNMTVTGANLWAADGINKALGNVAGDNTKIVLLVAAALLGAFLLMRAR